MKKEKIIGMICNILIVVLIPCFLLAICWYFTGSLEMFPTTEQEEKIKINAIILMIVTGVACVIAVIIRKKFRHLGNKV